MKYAARVSTPPDSICLTPSPQPACVAPAEVESASTSLSLPVSPTTGLASGITAVCAFGLTLPFTRMAVAELDPVLVACARAVIAAVCAAAFLAATRARLSTLRQWRTMAVVVAGVVLGFPVMSSLAMHTLPASHGAVIAALLPLSTAVFARPLAGERATARFWIWSLAACTLVVAYALQAGGGALRVGDGWMLLAVVLAGIGYAAGGRLSRSVGGPNVISWSLLLALPVTLPASVFLATRHSNEIAHASWRAWTGLGYVSLVSMFFGFFLWYRGLAQGGVARVGQTQQLQPFVTVIAAYFLLGEPIAPSTWLFAVAVLLTVAASLAAPTRTTNVRPIDSSTSWSKI